MDGAACHLPEITRLKYGEPRDWGWTPWLRQRYGYVSPDEWYEATVFDLVSETTDWLDVGCGRNIFPFNRATAAVLAQRARLLVGVDPSANVDENTLVHERARCLLEDYRTDRTFDLVTLRMVAEHIERPTEAAAALARLTRPGGQVLIYTVHKYSPAALLAAVTPFSVHVAAKGWLWGVTAQDTFPTTYRLNTHAAMRGHMEAAGFSEVSFQVLDDCRSFAQRERLAALELRLWHGLRRLGLRYPERCLLGLYRRAG